MAIVINLANKYNQRPSRIMGIDNDYLAYCFDETSYFLEKKATDDKGNINWNKIKWEDKKAKSNKDLVKFIQTGK